MAAGGALAPLFAALAPPAVAPAHSARRCDGSGWDWDAAAAAITTAPPLLPLAVSAAAAAAATAAGTALTATAASTAAAAQARRAQRVAAWETVLSNAVHCRGGRSHSKAEAESGDIAAAVAQLSWSAGDGGEAAARAGTLIRQLRAGADGAAEVEGWLALLAALSRPAAAASLAAATATRNAHADWTAVAPATIAALLAPPRTPLPPPPPSMTPPLAAVAVTPPAGDALRRALFGAPAAALFAETTPERPSRVADAAATPDDVAALDVHIWGRAQVHAPTVSEEDTRSSSWAHDALQLEAVVDSTAKASSSATAVAGWDAARLTAGGLPVPAAIVTAALGAGVAARAAAAHGEAVRQLMSAAATWYDAASAAATAAGAGGSGASRQLDAIVLSAGAAAVEAEARRRAGAQLHASAGASGSSSVVTALARLRSDAAAMRQVTGTVAAAVAWPAPPASATAHVLQAVFDGLHVCTPRWVAQPRGNSTAASTAATMLHSLLACLTETYCAAIAPPLLLAAVPPGGGDGSLSSVPLHQVPPSLPRFFRDALSEQVDAAAAMVLAPLQPTAALAAWVAAAPSMAAYGASLVRTLRAAAPTRPWYTAPPTDEAYLAAGAGNDAASIALARALVRWCEAAVAVDAGEAVATRLHAAGFLMPTPVSGGGPTVLFARGGGGGDDGGGLGADVALLAALLAPLRRGGAATTTAAGSHRAVPFAASTTPRRHSIAGVRISPSPVLEAALFAASSPRRLPAPQQRRSSSAVSPRGSGLEVAAALATAAMAAAGGAGGDARLFLSARQQRAIAAAEVREARRRQADAAASRRAAEAAARRAELDRLRRQADEAAVARAVRAAADRAEDAMDAAAAADAAATRIGPLAPSYTTDRDELVAAARVHLLRSHGARLAALQSAAAPATAATNPGATATADGWDPVLLALDALADLGPAGLRQAHELATTLRLPWHRTIAPPPAGGAASPDSRSRYRGLGLFDALPELEALLPAGVVTHIRVLQPPGGHTSPPSPSPRGHIVVLQPPGGAEGGGGGGSSGGGGDGTPSRTHVRVTQPAGGRSALSPALIASPDASPDLRRTAVHISQPAGGHSDLASWLHNNDAPPAAPHFSVHVAHPSGGASTMGALLTDAAPSSHAAHTTSVVVSQPAGGVSVIGELLAPPPPAVAEPAVATAVAVPPPEDDTAAPPRSSVHVSQPAGGVSTIGALMTGAGTGSGSGSGSGSSPPATGRRRHWHADASPPSADGFAAVERDAAPHTSVVVAQPPGGVSAVGELLTGMEAGGTIEAFVPTVRVTAPSGGTSTVQTLMYGERDAVAATADDAALTLPILPPVQAETAASPAAVVRRTAPPKSTATSATISDGTAWLPAGVAAAVTSPVWSPFGGARSSGVPNHTPAAGALSVGGATAWATLVARPLAAHLALLDRAAVALSVLKYDLVAHLRGLRAWMLLGEGQVATVFCEGLFERLAPTGGAPSVAALATAALPLGLTVNLANGVLRAAQGEAGLVEAAAELTEEVTRRTELLLASQAGAGVEDGAGLLRGARLHCATPPAAAFMHCFSYAGAGTADLEAPFDGWDVRATDALVPVFDWAGATLLPLSAARLFCAPAAGGVAAHPLAALLSPAALARYAAVHAFLLRLRRVSFEVRRLFLTLRHVRVPAAVHRFRHEAAYFVSALEAYVAAQALEAPTAAFMTSALPAASSMRDLTAAHDAYLRTLLARCLVRDPLGGSSGGGGDAATTAAGERLLAGVMATVLRFARLVYDTLAAPAPGAGAELGKLQATFRSQVRVVVVALSRMSDAAGGASHAADLLARLRGNEYWA